MLSCSQRQNLFMFAIQPYLPRECVGVKAASGGMFAGSTSTSCGISSGSSGIFGPQALQGYPEDPAEFKPLTEDELQRIKKERRQKEAQRKQKAAENRKHLANVRVVQKNLVFVVGLSQRLADPEVLKKHEYFGKFGKIHKVVINQSTSYAGAQGPSASAYVTYHRPEDALKAIQAVNNIHVDGRTLKASLGTTKYCSHFLRGSQCPKLDCMYLHELGEEAASFTKEEMQQGKHQEYEQKLYEMFMNSQNVMPSTSTPPPLTTTSTAAPTANSTAPAPQNNSKSRKKTSSPSLLSSSPTGHTPPPQQTNPVGTKEAWPSLPPQPSGSSGSSDTSSPVSIAPGSNKPDRLITNGNPLHSSDHNAQNRAPGFHRNHTIENNSNPDSSGSSGSSSPSGQYMNGRGLPPLSSPQHAASASNHVSYNGTASAPPPPGFMNSAAMAAAAAAAVGRKLPFQSATDSMSLFSSTNGFPAIRNPKPPMQTLHPLQTADDTLPVTPGIPDSNIPVSTSTDWQAAFGFTSTANTQPDTTHDDDLGFDPWNESAKALAEIIERENDHQTNNMKSNLPHSSLGHHTHSPQGTSPRQQQQQQQHNHHHHPHHPHEMQGSLRQPPGMPQLISSMAQITQLLENRPAAKTLPPGINPNHLGAAPNNQMGVPGSKIMGLMHFPSSVPQQNLANQSAYSDMMNSDSSHTAKREPFPHPQMLHKEDPTCNKDWQEGLRALLPNINIRFGGSQNAVDGQRLQNTQPQLHTGQQQATHKNWSSSHGTALDRSWDPAIVTSGHIPDGHSEEPHWMASLHQLTDDSTSLSNPSTARTQAPHRAPLGPSPHLYNTPGANNGSSWPPHTLGGAPHPPPGFHTPSTAPQIRPHSQVNTEVQQLADGYQ